MEQYFDLISLIPFIGIYYFTKNIVWASISSIVMMSLQVIYHKVKKQPVSKMLWFSLILLTGFTAVAMMFPEGKGSKVLLWKPTVINIIFALGLWFSKSKRFLETTIGHQLLESQNKQQAKNPNVEIPSFRVSSRAWLAVHDYWAIWFLCLAISNVFVVLYGTQDLWVTMKGINTILGMFVTMGSLFIAIKKYPQ